MGAVVPDDQFLLFGIGLVVILAAWVPSTIERRPVSLPIVLVALGAAMFALPWFDPPDPRDHLDTTRQLTEVGVLVALAGAGISIDRPVGLRAWAITWRLLSVGMIASIAGIAALGVVLLRLDLPTAVLLGAVLAPTDPVLASDVQVGEPVLDERRLHEEDDVRFGLTSEAGLNDGLAFPFVYLALALALAGASGEAGDGVGLGAALTDWFTVDLLYAVTAGVVVGWFCGRALGAVVFDGAWRLPPIASASQGFVALGLTMVAYGLTEAVHGYGFLAVFVAAVALRRRRRTADYHAVLHSFTIEIEQVVSSVLLVLFGGALSILVVEMTWRDVVAALAVLFVVRPIAGHLALLGSRVRGPERRAIAFFGIRGVGSVYYLAYAATAPADDGAADLATDRLWGVVACTLLMSIAVHGITATRVMERLDHARPVRHTLVRRRAWPAGIGAGARNDQETSAGPFRRARSAPESVRPPRRPRGRARRDRSAPAAPDPADPADPARRPRARR